MVARLPIPRIRCPRCGYDLRGDRSRWTDRCPIEGTCTECGLVFEWADLFSPLRRSPGWCVETDDGRRSLPARVCSTLAMTARPWRFWRELRLNHPARWRRVAVYLLLLPAAAYLIFAVGHGALAASRYRGLVRDGATPDVSLGKCALHAMALPMSETSIGTYTTTRQWTGAIMSPRALLYQYAYRFRAPLVETCAAVLVFALTPAGFLVLPVSRRRAKVRWSHVARITLYATPLLIPGAVLCYLGMLAAQGVGLPGAGVLYWLGTGPTSYLVVPILLLAWWGFAIGRYLRMRHAWGVAVAIVLMALLSVTLVGLLVVPLAEYW